MTNSPFSTKIETIVTIFAEKDESFVLISFIFLQKLTFYPSSSIILLGVLFCIERGR